METTLIYKFDQLGLGWHTKNIKTFYFSFILVIIYENAISWKYRYKK